MTRERRKGNISRDRWMVSYADFITLLFAFFVVMYAFAKADQKKQMQVSAAIDSGFSSLGVFHDATSSPAEGAARAQTATPMNIVMGENVLSAARVKDDLEHVRRELEQKLSSQVSTHTISIQMGRDGLVISLREAGFFSSGSATPKPESLPVLRQIAASLGHTLYDLRIEGHTDNIPIHTTEFDSNWELSSARATRIARFFIDLNTISPERISAAGYAEFHPVAGNDTADGRAENRRVDLVVLPRTRINFSAPESAQPAGAWRKITDNDAAARQ
jgi:chemotaxis protein MotB